MQRSFSLRRRTVEEITPYLSSGESVVMTIRQSLLTSIAPDVVIATNKKILVIHYSFWGLRAKINIADTTKVGVVMYKDVVSLESLKGKMFTSMKFQLRGVLGSGAASESFWTIDGIWIDQADLFLNTVHGLIEKADTTKAPLTPP